MGLKLQKAQASLALTQVDLRLKIGIENYIAALEDRLAAAERVIAPFANAGSRPNDFPLADEMMTSMVSYRDCIAAAEWMKKV